MSITGTWQIVVNTPMGAQPSTVVLEHDGDTLTGTQTAQDSTVAVYEGKVAGESVSWKADFEKPMKLTISFDGTVDGDTITGKAKPGFFPAATFTGERT